MDFLANPKVVSHDLCSVAYWGTQPIVTPHEDMKLQFGTVGRSLKGTSVPITDFVSALPQMLEVAGISRYRYLKQTHSDTVVPWSPSDEQDVLSQCFGEGDAWVLRFSDVVDSRPLWLGIHTADCVPILVSTDTGVAGIHAGWRGLANGVIGKALEALMALEQQCRDEQCTDEQSTRVSVFVGPCAGAQSYEVGVEVFEAIGESAEGTHDGHKGHLDVAATAATQITQYFRSRESSPAAGVQLKVAERDTITDPQWYSYRRDPADKGRNCTFIGLVSTE